MIDLFICLFTNCYNPYTLRNVTYQAGIIFFSFKSYIYFTQIDLDCNGSTATGIGEKIIIGTTTKKLRKMRSMEHENVWLVD